MQRKTFSNEQKWQPGKLFKIEYYSYKYINYKSQMRKAHLAVRFFLSLYSSFPLFSVSFYHCSLHSLCRRSFVFTPLPHGYGTYSCSSVAFNFEWIRYYCFMELHTLENGNCMTRPTRP